MSHNATTLPCRVVALVGASGSGKTTLARALLRRLGPTQAALLPMDAYYHDLSQLSLPERERVNFDHPDAIDLPLFAAHLEALRSGQAVEVPRYDFSRHTRAQGSDSQAPRPWIISEGLLLGLPVLATLIDTLVFVETPLDVCLERRLARDVAQRGRTAASVHEFWRSRALPMFETFGAPAKLRANIVNDGTKPPDAASAELLARLTGP